MEPMALLAFKVVIEPDEDEWRSYYPAWEHLGASTCGETEEEAAANIKEVLEMIVEEVEEGEIEWPVEPCPPWEFSKPSIQDAPELVHLNCAPEHPDAIASHGGLPLADMEPDAGHADAAYRLLYVAMEDVLASIHQQRTWRDSRTGGLKSRIFAPPSGYPTDNGAAHNGTPQFGYPSSAEPVHSDDRVETRTTLAPGG